ncbi:hypothetical protein E05_05310 [Plautia stali symbiont]|nr:hypothetical protein E05_05310 [Plautia stali symbiont]
MSVSANNLINRNIERVSALSVSQAAAFQAAILADVAADESRRAGHHGGSPSGR